MNKLLLEGKKAIVTGASSGIGFGIAEAFAREGASVALVSRTQEKLDEACAQIRANGGTCIGIAADVSKDEDTKRVFDTVIKEFGDYDILVNNAAMGSGLLSIEATSNEFYDELLDTNLRSCFMYCREAITHYLTKSSGVIINVASVNAVRPIVGAAYAAAKFGIVGMTKQVALRTVGTGIRCNVLCPGAVKTPMADKNFKGMTGMYDATEKVQVSGVLPVPDGKMGEILKAKSNRAVPCDIRELADAALFMASDMSSGMHGQVIVIDNGAFL